MLPAESHMLLSQCLSRPSYVLIVYVALTNVSGHKTYLSSPRGIRVYSKLSALCFVYTVATSSATRTLPAFAREVGVMGAYEFAPVSRLVTSPFKAQGKSL